jgi:F-box/TPR repeat protein Pof3
VLYDPDMAESSLLRRDAQKAYEKKDYKGALAALEKILASGPSNDELLATLDLRVSIYMKLDDKVSARKDATQMIRTNRADGRGYLRLGQLERLTDDHAAAIKWYEHGLKKVAERDRLHAYITAQHVKTTAMLKAKTVVSKPADPFAKLPAEIIEMIVRFFNYREAVICLRVSKTWRQVLHTYSTLRNTLDFSHVGKGKLVTFAGIKAALRRSQKAERPILVVAKDFTQPAARYLKKTMERWIHYTKMQHFEVDCPGDTTIDFQSLQWHQFQLRTVVFGSQHKISLDTVYKILQSCEALQKAVFLSVWPSSSNKEVDPWVQSTVVSRPNLVLLTIERAHAMGRQPLSLVMPVGPSLCRVLSIIADIRTGQVL